MHARHAALEWAYLFASVHDGDSHQKLLVIRLASLLLELLVHPGLGDLDSGVASRDDQRVLQARLLRAVDEVRVGTLLAEESAGQHGKASRSSNNSCASQTREVRREYEGLDIKGSLTIELRANAVIEALLLLARNWVRRRLNVRNDYLVEVLDIISRRFAPFIRRYTLSHR